MANEKRLDLIDRGALGIGKANPLVFEKAEYAHGWNSAIAIIENATTVDAVPVEQYMALREQYHELRENFIDYYCSGAQNVAPYCLNKCEECVDKWGYCKTYSDYCKGFNPAEIILDGDGNG